MNDNRQFLKKKNWLKRSWELRKRYSHNRTFKGKKLGAAPAIPANWLTRLLVQAGNTCTAYTAVAIKEATTPGVQFDPSKQWDAELSLNGGPAPDGVTADTMMSTGVKTGFFREGSSTPSDKEDAWFTITPTFSTDLFDQIKAAIDERPLAVSLNWYSDWDHATGPVPHTFNNLLGGHETKAYEICTDVQIVNGVECIALQGSWGPEYGNNGCFYFDRYMVNKCFFDVRYWGSSQDKDVKRLGLLESLLVNLINLYHQLRSSKAGYPPQLIWSDPVNARHSVRVICDQEGLDWNTKNILTACVAVESGFNPEAIHPNKDKDGNIWSTDFGIAQINDYFNIGVGKPFPSSDFVLQNPEACIRFMAKMFLAGKQSMWASYTSGLYKRYL